MIPADLEVRGTAVDAPTAVRPLCLADFPHKADYPHKAYYWIDPPGVSDKKWPCLSSKMKRKDEKLQELLGTPVEIKKRKTSSIEKLPFELNQCPMPTYKILSDIYKSQSKTLEDMKESLFGPCSYDKSHDSLFDLSILYPYMSNAYKKLYGQHIDNLKEISKNFKGAQPKSTKRFAERRSIKMQGIAESEESTDN